MTKHSTSPQPSHRSLRWRIRSRGPLPFIWVALGLVCACSRGAEAQISLSTAVDLALRSNPRVHSAEDDVSKAHAQLAEVHDAYVPVITAGGGIGEAYGYSSNPPTLATVSGGSLIFSASQSNYIRSARSGLKAAQLALEDARQAVAQDTALAFIALDHDRQREQAIVQQTGFANSLVTMAQQRLDAGQDTEINLTESQLTAAQLRLARMKTHDDLEYDREHLARLIDLPVASVSIDSGFPSSPPQLDSPKSDYPTGYANAGVAAAFASAQGRQQQAFGLSRFRFWPEINFFTQYNRYATFTESFSQLQQVYTIVTPCSPRDAVCLAQTPNGNSRTLLTANEGAFGIQISLPVLDKGRSAKAREAQAEADKAHNDAQSAQLEALDGISRIRHNLAELQTQSDVATLQQKLAQQQLDILQQQLNSGSGDPNAPPMSPKDQQKARIAERDKYLAVLDAQYQIRQAEIQLLRQTGELESWLRSSLTTPTSVQPPVQP